MVLTFQVENVRSGQVFFSAGGTIRGLLSVIRLQCACGASTGLCSQGVNMANDLTTQRLVALFCSGWMLLNFPLLGLWDVDATVLGVPVFPAALLALWALLIFSLAWLMERYVPDGQDD